MKNQNGQTDIISSRIADILEYVHHIGRVNEKPVFKIDEHKNLILWEHELKGRIGVHHNITDAEGMTVWLKIDRLKRTPPPAVKEEYREWITVSNGPEKEPVKKDSIMKTLSEEKVVALVKNRVIHPKDVREPLRKDSLGFRMKDVIFRLENNKNIEEEIDKYLSEEWFPWAEKEKLVRKTIKIYDSLFSIQQSIEVQGDEIPLEMIWGIGIARWQTDGHKIDYPLLEQSVEIEIARNDGAILIRPRATEPAIAVTALFALHNPGVDMLLRFGKKHFSQLSEDVEFSPYIHESFEPVLRQACTCLSESGIYWPDVNPDRENRKPGNITDTLTITDTWVIFARPRSKTVFVQDIERFEKELQKTENSFELSPPFKRLVTEPSDEKPLYSGGSFSSDRESISASASSRPKTEFYFPKPFNNEQRQIIEKLEYSDGVVVQGPPGTGKTHTIANIICHYLATGRKILVTSKGESALSVLQNQIPEEIRNLTISILSNEAQGMKQLEGAVHLLANEVSQTNLRELEQKTVALEQRVKQLEQEIRETDAEIYEWGLKQLKTIDRSLFGTDRDITAMELAQQIVADTERHKWFPDQLGASDEYRPLFSDSDIAKIREARRAVGKDIVYTDKYLPVLQDMPDTAGIVSIHNDLKKSLELAKKADADKIASLFMSGEKSAERAECPVEPLKKMDGILLLKSFSKSCQIAVSSCRIKVQAVI